MGFNKDQLLVIDINSGKVRRSAPCAVLVVEETGCLLDGEPEHLMASRPHGEPAAPLHPPRSGRAILGHRHPLRSGDQWLTHPAP